MCRLLPITVLFFAPALLLSAAPLALTRSIPLPNVHGRIDHFGYDRAGRRLFVAALGNDTLEVVDLAGDQAVRSLSGFAEPQGIAFAADLDRVFVANGGDGTVRVLDGTSLTPLASIALGDDADNVRYETATRRVYVGYGDGAIGIIDAPTGQVVGRIPLRAHPESFQLESSGPRVFINVPRSRELVVADRHTQKTVVIRSLLLAGGNFPLAFDEPDHRLFLGCRSPGTLLVLSSDNGYEVAHTDLHRDCDDVFYDANRRRLYASCGEGFIDVFSVGPQTDPSRIESVATVPGARTCYFDGEHLYLAVPQHGGHDAEIRAYDVK